MAQETTRTLPSMRTDVEARLIGLAVVAAAAGAGWYFGLDPLRLAQAGAPVVTVHYDPRVVLAVPMLLIGGIMALVGGAPVLRALSGPPRDRQQHVIVWSIVLLSIPAAGLAWWWLDAQFRALGYR